MATNYSLNPSAKNNTNGAGAGANGTLSRTTNSTSPWLRPTTFRSTRTSSGSGPLILTMPPTDDGNFGGVQTTNAAQIIASVAGTYSVILTSYDSGGAATNVVTNNINLSANTVVTTRIKGTLPSNARKWTIAVYIASVANNAVIGGTLNTLDIGTVDVDPNDGDSNNWSWDGTNGNSTSRDLTVISSSDSVSITESAQLTTSQAKNDQAAISESTSTTTTSQSRFDSVAATDIKTNQLITYSSSDSIAITDSIADIYKVIALSGSDQIAITDQINQSLVTQTRFETLAITESYSLSTNQEKSDSIAITESYKLEISSYDEISLIDEQIVDRAIESSDSIAIIEFRNLRSTFSRSDEITISDEVFVNEITIRHDDLITYDLNDSEISYRVIAQNMFTKEFIHWSLPVSNIVETFNITAPNSIQMELLTEIPSVLDLDPPLVEGGTWIYVEQDGELSAAYMLDPFLDDNVAQKRTLTGTGFSGYLNDVDYQGPTYKKIQIDPAEIIRYIWQYAQSYRDGNLGITLNEVTKTPKRLGTEQKDVDFQTRAGQQVSFEAGPYDLNFWELTNLGSEQEKLFQETPMEYIERGGWIYTNSGLKKDGLKYLDFKYPRVGIRRDPTNLLFKQGENMIQPIPAINRGEDYLVTDVIVIGAGEGPSTIKAHVARRTGTKRKTLVIEDESITRYERALAIARFKMSQINRSLFYIDKVVVDTMHPNAKWGEFEQGDDALFVGRAKWIGKFSGFFRITTIELDRRTRYAMLTVAPSESFAYGALEP